MTFAEEQLKKFRDNFFFGRGNRNRIMPEEILQKVKRAAKKVLDELEYTQFIMALEDEFEINIED